MVGPREKMKLGVAALILSVDALMFFPAFKLSTKTFRFLSKIDLSGHRAELFRDELPQWSVVVDDTFEFFIREEVLTFRLKGFAHVRESPVMVES